MGIPRDPYCACGTIGDIGHHGEPYCLPCYEEVVERLPRSEWEARWLDESGNLRAVPKE